MEKLKPCPFCGGEAIVEETKSTTYFKRELPYRVKCKMCHCALAYQFFASEQEAIAAWNRRANEKEE